MGHFWKFLYYRYVLAPRPTTSIADRKENRIDPYQTEDGNTVPTEAYPYTAKTASLTGLQKSTLPMYRRRWWLLLLFFPPCPRGVTICVTHHAQFDVNCSRYTVPNRWMELISAWTKIVVLLRLIAAMGQAMDFS
jgi:hypothetical protein